MPIQLNKFLFSRNHEREKNLGDVFSKTASGLTYITPLVITIFFTPAVITASLFSREIVIMLANLLLSLGYLSNFFYRMYHGEVSAAELLVSFVTLAGFLVVAYLLFPPIAAFSFLNVFSLINQMAIAVNLFFLFKDVIVPPCKKIIEHILKYLGLDISGSYYSKPELTLENDRHIIDRLLVKAYGHDSFSDKYDEGKLKPFNKLLVKLCKYIDKYHESILGFINNKEAIADLEKQIHSLTTQGNFESSFTFIRKKISFKTTKVKLLEQAQTTVANALASPQMDVKKALVFFINDEVGELRGPREEILASGLTCLEKEIQRQKEKIASLEECLPNLLL